MIPGKGTYNLDLLRLRFSLRLAVSGFHFLRAGLAAERAVLTAEITAAVRALVEIRSVNIFATVVILPFHNRSP